MEPMKIPKPKIQCISPIELFLSDYTKSNPTQPNRTEPNQTKPLHCTVSMLLQLPFPFLFPFGPPPSLFTPHISPLFLLFTSFLPHSLSFSTFLTVSISSSFVGLVSSTSSGLDDLLRDSPCQWGIQII